MIYMELQQIEDKLKTVLKPSRYRHTLGVAYTASCMAMVFDVDTERELTELDCYMIVQKDFRLRSKDSYVRDITFVLKEH